MDKTILNGNIEVAQNGKMHYKFDNWHVWNIIDGYQTAKLIEGKFTNHKAFFYGENKEYHPYPIETCCFNPLWSAMQRIHDELR